MKLAPHSENFDIVDKVFDPSPEVVRVPDTFQRVAPKRQKIAKDMVFRYREDIDRGLPIDTFELIRR